MWYNGILLSHTNEYNWVICRDVDRPRVCYTVIQREESEKEKNKCHILTHICGILKNGIDDLICKTEIETQM